MCVRLRHKTRSHFWHWIHSIQEFLFYKQLCVRNSKGTVICSHTQCLTKDLLEHKIKKTNYSPLFLGSIFFVLKLGKTGWEEMFQNICQILVYGLQVLSLRTPSDVTRRHFQAVDLTHRFPYPRVWVSTRRSGNSFSWIPRFNLHCIYCGCWCYSWFGFCSKNRLICWAILYARKFVEEESIALMPRMTGKWQDNILGTSSSQV